MPQFLKTTIPFLKSDYLTYFWWLMLGYVLCYGIAAMLAHALSKSDYTILYRCRKAWAIAFLVHTLFAAGVAGYWYYQNGIFASFGSFFPFYLALILVDVSAMFGMFSSLRHYVNYHQ